jgi:hypothetical protein
MAETIIGMKALQNRLAAIDVHQDQTLMEHLAVSAVAEQKRLVPRRTGNLGRSIHVGRVSATFAETVAEADYAAAVEFGSVPHDIRPSRKKVLHFQNSTGEAVFAKIVHHPGHPVAQPFMQPGAQRAVDKSGLAVMIITRWNKAG